MEKFKKEGAYCSNCKYDNYFNDKYCNLKGIYIKDPNRYQCFHHSFSKEYIKE